MNFKAFFSRHAALHGILILAMAGLGIDIYMRIVQGTSLCPTQSCAIVGDYVRLGELELVLMGLVFFALLWATFFFAARYDRKWLWAGTSILMLGALAFDGALLGFQFFSIKEKCHLCIGVGAGLLLSLVFLSLVRRSLVIFLLGLTIWLSGGIAGSMITVPDRTPPLGQLQPISWSGPDASEWPRFHYFFSLHCPHCTDVMVNLAMNQPDGYVWNIYPLDTGSTDLRKIYSIKNQSEDSGNLFYDVVRLEQSGTVPETEAPESLLEEIHDIRSYFQGSGYKSVPLMIVDESPGRRVVLTGGGNILNYLLEQGAISR